MSFIGPTWPSRKKMRRLDARASSRRVSCGGAGASYAAAAAEVHVVEGRASLQCSCTLRHGGGPESVLCLSVFCVDRERALAPPHEASPASSADQTLGDVGEVFTI